MASPSRRLAASFVGQPLGHGPAALGPGGRDDPPDRQRKLPLRLDRDRDLVVGPADPAAADLDGRLDVLDGRVEHLDRVHVGDPLLDQVHGVVEDAGGRRLLPVPHQAVDELADEFGVEPGVRLQVRVAGGKALAHA
jgi:hypothetical protein